MLIYFRGIITPKLWILSPSGIFVICGTQVLETRIWPIIPYFAQFTFTSNITRLHSPSRQTTPIPRGLSIRVNHFFFYLSSPRVPWTGNSISSSTGRQQRTANVVLWERSGPGSRWSGVFHVAHVPPSSFIGRRRTISVWQGSCGGWGANGADRSGIATCRSHSNQSFVCFSWLIVNDWFIDWQIDSFFFVSLIHTFSLFMILFHSCSLLILFQSFIHLFIHFHYSWFCFIHSFIINFVSFIHSFIQFCFI